jgi:hypothetical protein
MHGGGEKRGNKIRKQVKREEKKQRREEMQGKCRKR